VLHRRSVGLSDHPVCHPPNGYGYGSPSPLIGSDIESDYPAARPTVYQPRSIEASQAPLQVGADIRQPGSTIDPRVYTPEMATFVSLAAEVQPSSSYVAPTRTYTRSDTAALSSDMGQRSLEPMHIDVAAHSHVSPSIIADVAPSSITVAARHQLPAIVSRPSTADKRQPKSSVPIGTNEPSFGSVRKESQSGVIGFKSTGIKSQLYSVADVAEPRPTSVVTGHPLSESFARPPPVHARHTPTQTPTSMSAGLMSAAHAVCPSSVDAHVSRPTLADDEPAMRQPTPAYTGQYAAVCTGLQVQTSAETLTAQSLLLLGRCPTSPQSSSHSSVHEWLQATGTHAPPATPVESVSSSSSELQQLLAPRTEAPVVVPPSVRSSRASRMLRTSRRSVASSLAMEIFGFAREMSGQTAQLVGQMQDQTRIR